MTRHPVPEAAKEVPLHLPEIEIRPLETKPFDPKLRELPWWYVVPEVGNRTLWLTYEEPGWTLSGYTRLHAVCPAIVHRTRCVRIDVTEWERPGLDVPWVGPRGKYVYARQTEDETQWMAIEEDFDGAWALYTFQDRGFDLDFGTASRHVDVTGRFREVGPGQFEVNNPPNSEAKAGPMAAGVFDVRVGANHFECLRVWETGQCWQTDRAMALEAFVTRQGRTVLTRHYHHPDWAKEQDWVRAWTGGRPYDEAFPDHACITINGTRLVHWNYDLTGLGLGVSLKESR